MIQWINESVKAINQRIDDFRESMKQWINEWMTEWMRHQSVDQLVNEFVESMAQWISDSMNQLTNEWVNWWVDESMNQWNSESMNQSINSEPMSQWISESTNKLVSWWANESLAEPMNGWMSELLLCGATSSLSKTSSPRSLLSQQLLWAASYLGYFFSSWLFCNFCNPILLFVQLLKCISQPAAASPHSISQEWHYGQELPFAQLLQCVEQPPAAIPLARASQRSITESFAAGASHHIDQRSRSADNGDDSTLLRTCQIFAFSFVKPSSRYSLVRFLPTSSSNSVPHVW